MIDKLKILWFDWIYDIGYEEEFHLPLLAWAAGNWHGYW